MRHTQHPTSGHTADQVISAAYRLSPNDPKRRLAKSASGEAIGAWDEAQGRFVMVAGRIGNYWASMPYEVWIDGKPPVSEWVEVAK